MTDIRAATILPARRTPIDIQTADGLNLVGELALPEGKDPVATLVMLHPLPTHGGMMDSHLYRKASYRLPALADLAVVRFNTRGTESERGRSEGEFGDGYAERFDVEAAVEWAVAHDLPRIWLVGWSFGTEIALRWGDLPAVEGVILLSPPLHRATDADLDRWAASGKPIVALVPELDDYLKPDEARPHFERVPRAEMIAVDRAKHLWVGEPFVRRVFNEVVRAVNPAALTGGALPAEWPAPEPAARG
ncbi:MAG TPA: alpha/beta fold hydrolase [Trebonia sp.]|nr:alpha/beta fold hydrolase [Trebonia sp.]